MFSLSALALSSCYIAGTKNLCKDFWCLQKLFPLHKWIKPVLSAQVMFVWFQTVTTLLRRSYKVSVADKNIDKFLFYNKLFVSIRYRDLQNDITRQRPSFSAVDEGHPPWTLSTCVDDFGGYVYTAVEKRRHLLFCFMLVKKFSRVLFVYSAPMTRQILMQLYTDQRFYSVRLCWQLPIMPSLISVPVCLCTT